MVAADAGCEAFGVAPSSSLRLLSPSSLSILAVAAPRAGWGSAAGHVTCAALGQHASADVASTASSSTLSPPVGHRYRSGPATTAPPRQRFLHGGSLARRSAGCTSLRAVSGLRAAPSRVAVFPIGMGVVLHHASEPPDFIAWWRSLRVFRTSLVLLEISPPEPLDLYGEHIRTLTDTFGHPVGPLSIWPMFGGD